MTAEPRCWGGGVSHPSQLTTGLVIKSVTTSPTLAGERMLFILQVSILSEQMEQPDGKAHSSSPSIDLGRGKNGRQAPEPPLQLATRVGDEAENGDRAGRTTQRSSPLGIWSRRHRQHPRRRSFRGKQGRPRV